MNRLLLASILGATGIGCEPPLATELVYESDRVSVFVEPDAPFCRGDGARMDAHIEALSASLGIDPPERIEVAVVGDGRRERIAKWCYGDDHHDALGGCLAAKWGIMSDIGSLPHELNHAVFKRLNPDAPHAATFWAEAYASAWETHSTEFSPPTSGLVGQTRAAAYDEADHLIRWLQHTHGTAALADFYASLERDWKREDVDAAFAAVFGASYEEILAQYQSDAPRVYSGFGWCDEAEVIEVAFGETHLHLSFDCEAADTYALANPAIEAMFVRRILRLPDRSDLRIEYSSPARLLRVHPCFDEFVHGYDPRTWYDDDRGGVLPIADHSTRENVSAGDNEFAFAVPLGAPVELDLVIHATPTFAFEGNPPPDGEFFFVLSSDLTPELPLQFILTIVDEGDLGVWRPRFTLQPLSLDQGSQTQPREPVGQPFDARSVGVPNSWSGGELSFEVSVDATTIPGSANPSGGVDIELPDSFFFGHFSGPNALCGSLEGYADSWVPSVGGSFAAVRMEASPVGLLQQFPADCDQLSEP